MAQLVARLNGIQKVRGSNPLSSTIFVVRKSYTTKKAQDLVGLVLFCCYILWFAHFAEYLNSRAAFQYFF